MAEIYITDKGVNTNNLNYVMTTLSEVFSALSCGVKQDSVGARQSLTVVVSDDYFVTATVEICDKLSEVIAVNYKYNFFKNRIKVVGLSDMEKELLFASLISADLEEDKAYAFSKLKTETFIPLDGLFNFRMKPLKSKWQEIAECMPQAFLRSNLKDFIKFLTESRNKKIFIDCGKVYDSHYRRLNRHMLMGCNEEGSVIKEVLLSDGGRVELFGKIPEIDEEYLKEFFSSNITFRKDFNENVSKR